MHYFIVLNAQRTYRSRQHRIRQALISLVQIVKLLTLPDGGFGRQVLYHDHARILFAETLNELWIIRAFGAEAYSELLTLHVLGRGLLKIPVRLGQQLPSLHEIKLREKLEQLGSQVIPFLLLSLALLLLLQLLPLLLSELRRELLVSLLHQKALADIFLLKQLILNLSFALQSLFVLLYSFLPLRRYLIRIALNEGIFPFD